MRELIKQFVQICTDTLPIYEPIYEFGSFQVPGQEGFADLRPIFPNKEYVGCDMRKGPGVDCILNLHHIELPSESVGTVLVMDTLEHVEFPRKAIEEVHRILKPNGILIMSSHMNFPIHDHPFDYWRFTPEAFKSLLKNFTFQFVDFVGDMYFPHTIVGIGFKSPVSEECMERFMTMVEEWKQQEASLPNQKIVEERKQQEASLPNQLKILVKQFSPPILLGLYRKIR